MDSRQQASAAALRAGIAADALALGRGIDRWSLVFAFLALLWMALQATFSVTGLLFLLAFLAAGAQKLFALRVAFDRRIFARWAERWQHASLAGQTADAVANDLEAFDRGLAAAGMRKLGGEAPRGLDDRIGGALRLLRLQSLAFVIQYAASVSAALIAALPLPA